MLLRFETMFCGRRYTYCFGFKLYKQIITSIVINEIIGLMINEN